MACFRSTMTLLRQVAKSGRDRISSEPKALLPWFCYTLLVCAGLVGTSWGKVPDSASNRDPYPQGKGPVQVYLLAGQSNMQGHASLRNLEYLIYNDKTAAEYEHLKDSKGGWVERSDVWVWTNDGDRSGKLKPGFGCDPWKFGPELGFGWAVGPQSDRQVLIIKTCWGGRNVKCDFLSPGSPLPSEAELQAELTRYQKRHPDATLEDIKARYGENYRQMIGYVRQVLGNLKELFPKYNERQGYELAGMVWFQGWNDMVDGAQRREKYKNYTIRLGQMIKDLRMDLKTPNLPVVIGELGVGGAQGDFQMAQKRVAELPGLQGNVRFVPTHQFWEPEVEAMVKQGIWKGPDWPKFYNVGSERGYHYLGSGKIMYQMGTAFGQAMVEME